ncbi:MAG: RcnB family protein [Chloroflexota bacterium]|jgi:Ni/Co efflux regulator RcnB
MMRISFHTSYGLVLFIVGGLMANPMLADKPAWAAASEKGETKGKGHAGERDKESARDPERRSATKGHFSDRHRVMIRDYYEGQFRAGRCPPGLAKKRNGCMPPGQAKRWRIGRPLPRDVVFYDLPRALVVELGPPPTGYRYVRVAADILLIAVGTGMVIDAIQDLGRME